MNQIPTIINAALPVIIKVIDHTSWNRYKLKFGATTLSTKSMVPLEVGSEYFANINSQNGGVISINSLTKRQNDNYLENGIELIENLLQNGDISWFKDKIKNELINSKSRSEFEIYSQMLLALKDGVISVPFFYENRYCICQIKFAPKTQFYLMFGSFAPLLAFIENAKFNKIITPYSSFSKALGKALKCEYLVEKIEPLWQKKENFVDFKG